MTGQTILHYTILEKLGEGGMGVVYKAEDTKLKRTVALKFLPPHLAASEGDKARFIQEAQAASALNHPNVCTIHDIQEHDGPDGAKQMFIVMEYVTGQTLRDMMGGKKGADTRTLIPLNRATEIGIQVADGLAAAHEKGIVHRDIKPENIMVRKDGIAQIMDFGLAKLRSSTGSRLTQQGSTVGTAGYMSPEQIQGTDADHRSDVFSLGVVLYELFTGELPFKGVHETALLYEIVNVDPVPMTTINPDLNPELDRIVFECLQKEPDERFQSVKDISKELKRYKRESSRQRATRTMATRQFTQGPGTAGGPVIAGEGATAAGRWTDRQAPGHEPTTTSGRAGLSRFLWPAVSVLLAAALTWFVLNAGGEAPPDAMPVMRFPVILSLASPLSVGAATLAISPDGKNFAYLAGEQGGTRLYLRPLDKLDATPMTGTEFASDPFFSDDGTWVGYFVQGKIRKISIFGGAAQDVCDVAGFMRGACWASGGTIFFGHLNRGIFRVPAAGGTPEEITVVDTTRGEISHRYPQALPGGKWVVFTVKFDNIATFDDAAIVAENVETHERRELIRGGAYARYLSAGYLMYARGTSLYAVPFDADQVKLTGTPLPVAEGGMLNPFSGTANFEVSRTGIMIYTPVGPAGAENVNIEWMDRSGKTTRIISEGRYFDNPRLSPDGKKIALTMRAANDDIWVYDLERAALSRLTFGGGNSDMAFWMPDGDKVIYYSERRRSVGFYRSAWDGSGKTEDLGIELTTNVNTPPAVTPDGKRIIYNKGTGDIESRAFTGDTATVPILNTSALEDGPRLSPDGRLLAYNSDESGRFEVYVVPYPGRGGKWQISTAGASSPAIWSRDGKELFYAQEGKKVMAVDVSTSQGVRFSPPRAVCNLPSDLYGPGIYDISPDGKRFLVGISEASNIVATQVNVVVGWFGELKQKFASK